MNKQHLFFFVILVTITYTLTAQNTMRGNWLTNIEEAKREAEATQKPILVYFTGSDWCGPCKMLKQDFFNTHEFEKRANKLVLLLVDMPRRKDIISKEQQEKNNHLVRKYNRQGSYPLLVALNDKGKLLGELSGYTFLRETERHFIFIDTILENY